MLPPLADREPFLQFPLCSLAFGTSPNWRLNAILHFSVVNAGLILWGYLTVEERRAFASRQRQFNDIPSDFNEQSPLHWAALYGAEALGIRYATLVPVIKEYQWLKEFVAEYETRHGRDALIRIKRRWLFKTRDHQGLTYREFAVLCAIYSVIGDKKMAIITQQQIRHRALGYRNASLMQAELANRSDGAIALTERQLRDTIMRLHQNRFFARRTISRRVTYYSIRLDNEELGKKILERRTYPGFFRACKVAEDQALTTAIKQRRAKIAQPGGEP